MESRNSTVRKGLTQSFGGRYTRGIREHLRNAMIQKIAASSDSTEVLENLQKEVE